MTKKYLKSMNSYQTKSKKIAGTNLTEVYKNSEKLFKNIARKTKRRPYVRSAYFKKEKIFFDYFWNHLRQKVPKERFRRLKFFEASVELIINSRNKPTIEPSLKKNEILYRFSGITAEKKPFYVQIKEDRRKRKYFMSCFPQK
jgi:hypothetical protein